MTSKRYTLLASLLLATATTGFSQLGGVVDYKDSTKVPAKRMAQQNEWRHNSKTNVFPARPRDMWQVGVFGGYFMLDADCPTIGGWNAGFQIRKSLGYVFSVRGTLAYGQTKGLDYQANANISNNKALAIYKTGASPVSKGYYVHNYKTTAILPSLELITSLNNIMFHKKSSNYNVYVVAGYAPTIYNTKLDALKGANEPYDYPVRDPFFNRPRKDIRSDLKDLFDGDYETQAKVRKSKQNFDNGKQTQYQLRHTFSTGIGVEYKIAKKMSLSLEAKYIWTGDDYMDGWYLTGAGNPSATLTPEPDNIFITNLGINFNIGSSAKRVAPLWWLNPLGHIYSELSNPTNMNFPKPILEDTDGDGVTDQFDIEPNTPAGCPVDTHGKSRDTDGDGVPDCKDKELITPTTCQPVDADGVGKCPDPPCCANIKPLGDAKDCGIGSLPSISFGSGTKLSKSATALLDGVSERIKANAGCKILVVGHGNASKRAQQLSWARVEAVIKYLVEKKGISRDRFGFKYGIDGDANTVDLQDGTGSDEPSIVPAPHPQYGNK